MITNFDIKTWKPSEVRDWLSGICENDSWLRLETLTKNKVDGKKLMLMTPEIFEDLGATKVNLQEIISEAIERLQFYTHHTIHETLQASILILACQSRSLHRSLASKRNSTNRKDSDSIVLSSGFKENNSTVLKKQRVSLETLTSVSTIVTTVKRITYVLNCPPFSKYDDYKSMKSLILALSIELTSTAQRDQFVERPNDIIEKSSKTLADYCDRIVYGTKDSLLIQPFYLETVKIEKSIDDRDLGMVIKSSSNNIHMIDKITPLSLASKTNKLDEGDEILQFNQFIVGWEAKNVERLIYKSSHMNQVVLMVKKRPVE